MAIDVQTKINLVTTDPFLAMDIRGGPEPRDEFLNFQLGRDYDRYLKMERDPEVRRSLARRRQMILGRRIVVEPASPSRVDKQAAQFCQGLLDGARPAIRYQALNSALLHKGQLIGFSVVRIDWEQVGDLLLPRFQSVPQSRFQFAYAQPDRTDIPVATSEKVDPKTDIVTVAGYELRLLTKNAPLTGERCPKKRFLVYTFDDEESPWGLGLGYSIYPYWTIKRESLKAWLLHSDRQGSPPVTGEHPQDVNDQSPDGAALISKFERFLKSVSPNAWARLPVGWSAKILETVGTAGPEVHQQLIAECNREIQICTIGELLFSDKASGSYAANASQNDSEQALIDGDCAILDEQLADLWTWICELNSLKGDPPIVRRELFADVRKAEVEKEKEQAKESRLGRDKSLFELGYRVKPEAIAEIYGEEYEAISTDEPNQETALISVLGIPATQALMQFIQGLANSGLSRDAAISVLTGVFGVDPKLAKQIVPEEQPQPQDQTPDLQTLLNSPDTQPADNTQFEGLRQRVLDLSDRYLSVDMAERKFKRNQCEQGFSCGHNTCISQNLPCPNPLIGQSVNYAEWLQSSVPGLMFAETLNAIADGTWDYAAKGGGKKKNCNPAKSHFCQTPSGAGSCVPLSRKCRYQPQGAVKQAANAIGQQARKSKSTAAPQQSSNPIKVNQSELDSKRADLEKRFGKQLVEDAENNVKRVLDDAEVFVRMGSTATLEQVLGDRFRTSAELGVKDHQIPNLKDKNYQDARNRVESKVLGYDAKNTNPEDRPIYGYLGSKDLNGQSHSDVSQAYGTIALKLKPEVKDRTTFTGSDSFKSGIASQVKNDGTPPPPNAASLVSSTRHGYDKTNLPNNYPSYFSDTSADGGQLRAAARARSIDDLTPALAPTGNAYIEAQIHGKVTPKDIAEIHFSPRGVGDRPSAAIAQFAKDNGVDLYVNGKKLGQQELDDIITPPKRTRINELNDALERGDFDEVLSRVEDLDRTAQKLTLASGETDRHLKALYQESGFDGLPKVASADDVSKVWQAGGTLMTRGVSRASSSNPNQYFDDFCKGDYFTGNGMYGNGTYVGHAGNIVNGQFVGYNAKTAKKDGKRALNDVARHNYISAQSVNFRMALDPSAVVGIQSKVSSEQFAISQKFDAWTATERAKIKAANSPKPADVKKYNAALKQAVAANSQLTPTLEAKKSLNGGQTTKHTYSVGTGSDKRTYIITEGQGFKSNGSFGKTYTFTDENGKVVQGRNMKDAISRATAAVIAQKNKADALKISGLKADPNVSSQALKEFDDRVETTKKALGLDGYDSGSLGRFAVVRGYDAIALDNSYEPDTFMNLLNRSKVTIQKDPLDWTQAKKTGAY
jgi:hypothetical protein